MSTCGKPTYPSESSARNSAVNLSKHFEKNGRGRRRGHAVPMRAYYCGKCSGWHLTRKNPNINTKRK